MVVLQFIKYIWHLFIVNENEDWWVKWDINSLNPTQTSKYSMNNYLMKSSNIVHLSLRKKPFFATFRIIFKAIIQNSIEK